MRTKQEIEKEFDEKYNGILIEDGYDTEETLRAKLKSFISSTLERYKREAEKEGYKKGRESRDEEIAFLRQEAYGESLITETE